MNLQNTAIIHITTSEDGQQTVNARELHRFLQSNQHFANWIKARIDKYKFLEGSDYTRFKIDLLKTQSTSFSRNVGGRPATEYLVTTDMAMKLSMVENTTKGNEARDYFILCHRKVKQAQHILEESQRTLPPQAAAVELPPLVQLHRAQLAYLMEQGVPAGIACRSADLMVSKCQKLPEYAAESTEIDNPTKAAYLADILCILQPEKTYTVDEIADLLPAKHPLLRGSRPSRRSRIGKVTTWAATPQIGRLEKSGERTAFYRLRD